MLEPVDLVEPADELADRVRACGRSRRTARSARAGGRRRSAGRSRAGAGRRARARGPGVSWTCQAPRSVSTSTPGTQLAVGLDQARRSPVSVPRALLVELEGLRRHAALARDLDPPVERPVGVLGHRAGCAPTPDASRARSPARVDDRRRRARSGRCARGCRRRAGRPRARSRPGRGRARAGAGRRRSPSRCRRGRSRRRSATANALHVRHPGPRQRQAQPPDPGQHALAPADLAASARLAHRDHSIARGPRRADTIGACPADPAANAALINRFYEAFARQRRRGDGRLLHARRPLPDPVFTRPHGDEVGAMWRMLCGRGNGPRGRPLGRQGRRRRPARPTGRPTTRSRHRPRRSTTSIDASFRFENGLIADHRDSFDLYAWARQALGPVGVLLGWAPPIQSKIRAQAQARAWTSSWPARRRTATGERPPLGLRHVLAARRARADPRSRRGDDRRRRASRRRSTSWSSTSSRASALVPRFRQRITPTAARARQPGLGRRPALRHQRHVRRVALPEPGRRRPSCASSSAG